MNLKEALSNDLAKELRRRGWQVTPPDRREKDCTIVRRPDYHVYMHNGRYYLDLFDPERPIHSYSSYEAVISELYYIGRLPAKTSEL